MARTVEVLDQRGVAGRFLAEGQQHPVFRRHGDAELADAPTRHPCTLGIWQNAIERIMGEWIVGLGVAVRHGREVVGRFWSSAGGPDAGVSRRSATAPNTVPR